MSLYDIESTGFFTVEKLYNFLKKEQSPSVGSYYIRLLIHSSDLPRLILTRKNSNEKSGWFLRISKGNVVGMEWDCFLEAIGTLVREKQVHCVSQNLSLIYQVREN